MIERTVKDLIDDLDLRRREDEPRPVVLLGAGASVDAGVGAMPDLMRVFGASDFEQFSARIQTFSEDERYRLLARFLQSQKPAEPTPGYRALAALCAEGYFDVILTTNLDPLLDDALAAARLWRRDYLLLVNGVVRPDRLEVVLRGRSPRVKVIKLHGDLFHRFMAWTPGEMATFVEDVAPTLRRTLYGRDVLVVGHSLRDDRIRRLVVEDANLVWYTHPKAVPAALTSLDKVRAIVGADCVFERLFPAIASGLNVASPGGAGAEPAMRERVRGGARTAAKRGAAPPRATRRAEQPVERQPEAKTIDDLMASVLALEGPSAGEFILFSTAFILAEPRVIVCDALALDTWAGPRHARGLVFVAADGRRIAAEVLRRYEGHPAGPAVFAMPPDLALPGLQLDDRPLAAGQDVRIAVAAGERVGVSRARVRDGREMSVAVQPVGTIAHLVALDGRVTGGSSGGPVVDGELRVRGFVVAGDQDAERPTSLIYPASRWASFVRTPTASAAPTDAARAAAGRGKQKGRRQRRK